MDLHGMDLDDAGYTATGAGMTRRGQWVVHIVTGIVLGVILALVTARLSAYLFPDGWPRS